MHRLDLGVVLEGVGTELTAKTRLLEASEGSLVRDEVVAVDPDGTARISESSSSPQKADHSPSLESIGDADGGVDVLSVDGSSKAYKG